MTTQEYVKKEAEKFINKYDNSYRYAHGYSMGLSAGIELAKAFAEWVDDTGFVYNSLKSEWDRIMIDGDIETSTTSELFEIFLTEKRAK